MLAIAESEREGGVSPNILSFPHIADFGNLMHKMNYKLPSLSVYRYRYLFSDLSQLFEFLKVTGETNPLKSRRLYKHRDTFIAAMALYQSSYNLSRIEDDDINDKRIIKVDLRENYSKDEIDTSGVYSSIEISSFICWKYHPSQPVSKERGSAEINLKDIANEILDDNKDEVRFGTIKLKDSDNGEEDYEIIETTNAIKDRIRKKLGDERLKEILKGSNEKIDSKDDGK